MQSFRSCRSGHAITEMAYFPRGNRYTCQSGFFTVVHRHYLWLLHRSLEARLMRFKGLSPLGSAQRCASTASSLFVFDVVFLHERQSAETSHIKCLVSHNTAATRLSPDHVCLCFTAGRHKVELLDGSGVHLRPFWCLSITLWSPSDQKYTALISPMAGADLADFDCSWLPATKLLPSNQQR